MKKKILLTVDIDESCDSDSINMITEYLLNELPSIYGDGDVFVNSFTVEILEK